MRYRRLSGKLLCGGIKEYAINKHKNTANRSIHTDCSILCNDSFCDMVDKDYPPLTEEQKKDMSAIGIEWYNRIREKSIKENENEQHNSIR